MKSFVFGIYNEKLKINPVSLKTFDSIKLRVVDKISKENLCTFDIIRFARNDKLYMTFLSDTVHKLNMYVHEVEKRNNGIFVYNNEIHEDEMMKDYHFMFVDDYDENLNFKHDNNDWNISDVYYHIYENLSFNDLPKIINQDYLRSLIKSNEYMHLTR